MSVCAKQKHFEILGISHTQELSLSKQLVIVVAVVVVFVHVSYKHRMQCILTVYAAQMNRDHIDTLTILYIKCIIAMGIVSISAPFNTFTLIRLMAYERLLN